MDCGDDATERRQFIARLAAERARQEVAVVWQNALTLFRLAPIRER
jgi:hypothetical protein